MARRADFSPTQVQARRTAERLAVLRTLKVSDKKTNCFIRDMFVGSVISSQGKFIAVAERASSIHNFKDEAIRHLVQRKSDNVEHR